MNRATHRSYLGIAMGLAACVGCTKPVPPPTAPPPAPVLVAKAVVKTVPIELRSIGNVRVYATVAVRPRVGGELVSVHFKEGEFVKVDQKLFTIDPKPYEASLKQATAQLERDLALMRGAELLMERSRRISGTAAITADELDKLRTEVESARATVTADRAALRTAELQLGYTTIVSPINGRTGNLLVTQGNLLTANESAPLVVINQITPISVAFNVPEENLPEIKENLKQNGGKLPVAAILRGTPSPLSGDLTFVDNAVDPTTGTVQLKATFTNQDRRLWPGQFVDVILTLSERKNCVTIPSAAIQEGQEGPYVFVVDANDKAEMKHVKLAFITADGEAIIDEGLAGGETVVIEGHLRISDSGKVSVKGNE